ncbi:MAG TPA: ribonuclease HI [Bryobacteraceae bacterium]|nr:ribonuclease HI [Bryobacteraceae bacterium]
MTMLCRFPSASKSGSITGLAIDYPRPSAAADGLGMVRRIAVSAVGDMWCRRMLAAILAAAESAERGSCGGEVQISYWKGGQSMGSEVEIAVDGSCLGNPGPGGWACILRYGESERVLQGAVVQATNNRMEMTAAIEGLRALKRPCAVRVFTDSEYLLRGMTQFLERWQANGWRSSSGNGVANQDLWEELAELASYHRVTWIHVGGHSGHSNQERCDRLASRAAREVRQSWLAKA